MHFFLLEKSPANIVLAICTHTMAHTKKDFRPFYFGAQNLSYALLINNIFGIFTMQRKAAKTTTKKTHTKQKRNFAPFGISFGKYTKP